MQPSLGWWETQGAEIHSFTSSEIRADSTCFGWTPGAAAHSRVEVGGYGQNRTALTLWARASSCCSAHSCCWALSSALYSASLGSSCSQRLRAFCTAVSTYRRWQERDIARVEFHSNYDLTHVLHCVSLHYNHTDFIPNRKQQSFFLNSYSVPCKGEVGICIWRAMQSSEASYKVLSIISNKLLFILVEKLKYAKGSPSATCQSLYSPPPRSCSTNTPYEHIHRHASCKHRLLLSRMNLDIRIHMTLQVQTRTQGVISFMGGQSLSHFFLLSNTDIHMAMQSWHKQLPVKVLTAHAQKLQLVNLEQEEKSSHRNLCLLETFNPYRDSFPYLSSSDLKFHIHWEALLNTSLSNILLTVVKTSEDWGPGTPFVDQDGLALTM